MTVFYVIFKEVEDGDFEEGFLRTEILGVTQGPKAGWAEVEKHAKARFEELVARDGYSPEVNVHDEDGVRSIKVGQDAFSMKEVPFIG